jgi:hypothetical protein
MVESSEPKKLEVKYNGSKTIFPGITSFHDLIISMFKAENKEYLEEIPEGVDARYDCNKWFNLWYEDARGDKYAIGDEEDF